MTFFRSQCLESGDVVVGDDPTDQQQDVLSTFGLEEVDDPRDEYQVGPGEQRETEGVRVFLDDGLDDLLGRLVQTRVDDLETGVAKGASDDLGATVVPIKTGLGDDDSVRAIHGNLIRSEEHTSELQSLRHLVCRLLLEKKKPTQRRKSRSSSAGDASSRHSVYGTP